MKKLFILTLLFAISFSSFSQTIVDSTGFYGYAGTAATAPAGWYMSWHSATSPSYYSTTINSGIAPPSYKFGNDTVFVISPQFAAADTVSFWCKGLSISGGSRLNIYYSTDSVNWTMFNSNTALPSTGTIFKYAIPYGAKWLMFVYRKVAGNLAFDDVKIIDYPNITINCTLPNTTVCLGTSICFNGCLVNSIYPVTSYNWAFGDSTFDTTSVPCHTYLNTGAYTTTTTVYDIHGDSGSVSIPVTVAPLPVAGFSSTLNGATVCFTDTVTFNPSLCSYSWSFGDGNNSSIQNPCHTYTVNGTYTVCYTVVSCNTACAGTVCGTVNITQVGVAEWNNKFQIKAYPSVSTTGIFTLQMNMQNEYGFMEVYNMLGKKIYEKRISDYATVLDLSGEKNGIYFVKIATESGSVTKKIVIAK